MSGWTFDMIETIYRSGEVVAFIVWVISSLLNLYTTAIVVWCILTWFPGSLNSKVGEWLTKLVGPYLDFFERVIPPLGGVSFAPVVAIMVLWFAQSGIRFLGQLL